jgi:Chaperone of endosialidase
MKRFRISGPAIVAVVALIVATATLAGAQTSTTFLIGSGRASNIQASTSLTSGPGPGLLFLAANGRRRDIVAFNNGLGLGASTSTREPSTTLQVCDNGGVGIGLTSCPKNILEVQRRSSTDPVADAWTTYSSRTYKTDITQLTDAEYRAALQSLLDTPLVRFHYKGQATGEKLKLGIIAEDAPEAIIAEGNDKAVSLGEYISLLHAAVVAQQTQIETQQAQIEELQAAIAELK